jgi:hypothetical protein
VFREHVSNPESGCGRSRGDSDNERNNGGTSRTADRGGGVCEPNSRQNCHRVRNLSPEDSTVNTYSANAGQTSRKQKSN